MKVLIAHNDYGKPSGEEHACESLAALLRSRGHETVWRRRRSAEIGEGAGGRVKAFFAGLWNPAEAGAISRLIALHEPDVMLAQNLYPFLSPSILRAARAAGLPVVMRCPNYRLFCPSGLHLHAGQVCTRCLGPGREAWCLLRNCERDRFKSAGYALRNATARLTGGILNNVDVFVVLSTFQRDRFARLGIPDERLAIVPNVTPPELTDIPPGSGTTVSFLGRVAPEKGFDDFVAIAAALPDIPFAVAGEIKEGYAERIGGLPANVCMRGFLKGSELDRFVRETRMLLSCSRWFEGFPNTLTRVMAAGKPVVAAAIGAIPEIVDNGRAGRLYEPGKIAEAAACVRALYPDAAACRRLGEAGRKKALTAYSEDTVCTALETALEQALALHRASAERESR